MKQRHALLPLLGALFFFTGCAPTYPCGDTQCGEDQYCDSDCGLAGGQVYTCEDQPSACDDCSCLVLRGSQACTMVDGHPEVSTSGCI